jgi:beta-glucosidase
MTTETDALMKIPPYATVPYRDPSLPVADRAADLLARMTVGEKLGQLGSVWAFQIADERGLDVARATPLLADGIGHVTRVSGASSLTASAAAELANSIQRHLIERTRLGIPAILHEEICSGLMARQAAVFPQALGVAATFRPDLNRRLADSVRAQMRAMGAHQGLSPVLDVCRDPRWGRLEESYGEDPFLVSQMGIGFITGLQGSDDGRDLREGVVATAKHFVGYGAPEGGMNWAPAHIPERELRDVYLRPFEAAVRDAGLGSVMNAYQELDGVPCAANRWLLTDLLRGDWGFEGTVVSDYFAIKQLDDYHHIVVSWEDAAVTALTAGIDVELPSTECYGAVLRAALDRGAVAMADVDEAVRRALESKLRLGLFERPYVDVDRVALHTRTRDQIDLSRSLATESLVLLRNDGILPLRPAVASLALIGPNAANARQMLGDYSYITHVESLIEVLKSGDNVFAMPIDRGIHLDEHIDLGHVVTVHDALVAALPDVMVRYVEGCTITSDDRSGFATAVEAAASSDIAVMVMGERSGLTEDCTTGESRDVTSLGLPGVQEALVHAVAATGTPVVLVLVAGRPVGSPAVHAAANAVLMAWLPGEQGGLAIAEVLTGSASPGGKLPISYPRTSGQIPVFYAHKVSGGRSHWKGTYVDESNEPLYPFGHGLGYSTFTIVAEGISPPSAALDDTVEVRVLVTNTGERSADEVVQLYAHDPVASITRPVRELIGFARVTLAGGDSVRVTFQVPVTALGFSGRDLTYVVEPGDIEFFVGSSSSDLASAGTVVVTGDKPMPTVRSTTNHVIIQGVH